MRKLLPMLAVAVFVSCLSVAYAAGEVTLKGGAVCAKCALKEKPTCQNVLLVEKDGKTTKYYLDGPESKKAHGALGICTAGKDAPIKVKVTGKCEKKGDDLVVTVEKIEKQD